MKIWILIGLVVISISLLAFSFNDYENKKFNEINTTEYHPRDGYREVERLQQSWNATNEEWINEIRHTSEYLTDDLLSFRYGEIWENEEWEFGTKVTYTYSGVLNTELLVQNNENGNWINALLYSKTYDDYDNLTLESYFNWENDQWYNQINRSWFYENGNCNLYIIEQINNAQDIDSTRYTYNYDENNNCLSSIKESKDEEEWQYESREDYYYESNILDYSEFFFFSNGNWLLHSKNSYAYDDDGNILERLLQFWINEEWANMLRSLFFYDENNNEILYQKEDFIDNTWEIIGSRDKLYDEHDNMISATDKSWEDGQSTLTSRDLYTYEIYTGVEEHIETPSLLSNYPNPFNPETTISFSVVQNSDFVNLDVYNIKGQKVKALINEEMDKGKHSIVWSGLDSNNKPVSSGIYLYKISTDNQETVKRMLLLK